MSNIPRLCVVPIAVYDRMVRLTKWQELTPEDLDLGDHALDYIAEEEGGLTEAMRLPEGFYVCSTEMHEGDLIALVVDESDLAANTNSPELRVLVARDTK